MDRRGQKLRFTAVAVFVVLALTGFSTSRGHGHGSSHHSGGSGGCSSSGQDHDSSSSTSGSTSSGSSGSRYHDYDDDDDHTDDTNGKSGSAGTSTTLRDATVELIACATPSEAYATVQVTNPNSAGGHFTVTVDFLDADSHRVEQRSTDEYVAGNDAATVRVDLSGPGAAAKVDHCEADPAAPSS